LLVGGLLGPLWSQAPVQAERDKGEAADMYDYEGGRVVVRLTQKLDNKLEDHITYTKTVPLIRGRFKNSVTVSVEVNTKENYYTIQMVTEGLKEFENGGLGYRAGIFAFCDDWNIRKDSQVIYASGAGLKAALKDLETKFNGARGKVSFAATGDVEKGELVITISNK